LTAEVYATLRRTGTRMGGRPIWTGDRHQVDPATISSVRHGRV